jgi:hypothetical protein
MANAFTGKLDVQSADLVPGMTDMWDMTAAFIDMTGACFASDVQVGDIVYNDGTWMSMGLLRYEVIGVDPITDYNTMRIRMQWALPGHDPADPLTGSETAIGRPMLGAVFLPSSSAHQVSESLLQYARNIEVWLAARYSYLNRVFNAPFDGALDGINRKFSLMEGYIRETLTVKFNSMEMLPDVHFQFDGSDVVLPLAPTINDTVVFDYNRS